MEENLEQSESGSAADNQTLSDPTEPKQDSKALLGRFATVETLAKAYEELQGAFTKKSQELAELKNNNASAAQQKEVEKNAQVSVALQSDKSKTTKEIIGKSTEEIIKDYLLSVARGKSSPTVITGSGNGFAFSNVTEARTIHATTKVAENFFKEKKI